MQSVIVIGAGAAGLMAAYELSKKYKVTVLESTARSGGRIYTYNDNNFSMPVELGAEFIHGKLPLTLQLLKQAGIKYHAVQGKMYHLEKGKFKKQNFEEDHWNDAMKQMKALKSDLPLSDFLIQFFNDDKYEDLRQSIKGYAEGFDLADVSKVSTKFLYNEWSHEDDVQYRIEGGYQQLITYLESECKKNGFVIYTNCCVKKINRQKNEVHILTMCSRYFKSDKVVITVPLDVLQANENDINHVEFTPAINSYLQAAKNIGFGRVIKIILEFAEPFWQYEKKNTGFVFTSRDIPVWWSQLPNENAILTGWLGGAKTLAYKDLPDEDVLDKALQSLSSAFAKTMHELKKKLIAWKIINNVNKENLCNGYSYGIPGSNAAKELLNQPIEQAIFFAGEALYSGISQGTVEAALESGKQAAEKIINDNNL